MTATTEVWVTTPGWTRAHLERHYGAWPTGWTYCGREIRRDKRTYDFALAPRCLTCKAARP